MAATWEITCISTAAIDSKILAGICEDYKINIKVKSISCIDDWTWSNQQTVQELSEIAEKLQMGKVIVIDLESETWESLGMYIEKEAQAYIYTFWLNTKGFPALDSDYITADNQKYYHEVYRVLKELDQKYATPFQVIAMGVETNIQYSPNMEKMIANADHVAAWVWNIK